MPRTRGLASPKGRKVNWIATIVVIAILIATATLVKWIYRKVGEK